MHNIRVYCILLNYVLFLTYYIYLGLIYFSLEHQNTALVRLSITKQHHHRRFHLAASWLGLLGTSAWAKSIPPLRLKECLQVPIQMVIKKLFNPLRKFPGVTPQGPSIRRCLTQAASGQC